MWTQKPGLTEALSACRTEGGSTLAGLGPVDVWPREGRQPPFL